MTNVRTTSVLVNLKSLGKIDRAITVRWFLTFVRVSSAINEFNGYCPSKRINWHHIKNSWKKIIEKIKFVRRTDRLLFEFQFIWDFLNNYSIHGQCTSPQTTFNSDVFEQQIFDNLCEQSSFVPQSHKCFLFFSFRIHFYVLICISMEWNGIFMKVVFSHKLTEHWMCTMHTQKTSLQK